MPIKYIGVKVHHDVESRIRSFAVAHEISISEVVKTAIYRFFEDETATDRIESRLSEVERRILRRINILAEAPEQTGLTD